MRFFLKLKQVKKAIEEKMLWMKIENFNWSFFQQRGWGADKKVHLAVLTNLMILVNCMVLHGPELQWYYLSDHEWLIYIFRKKIGRMFFKSVVYTSGGKELLPDPTNLMMWWSVKPNALQWWWYLYSAKGKMGKSAMKILGMKDEEFYEVRGWYGVKGWCWVVIL